MADFSEQSANLSAPSGAGDQPVVTQKTQVSDGGLVQRAIGSVASMIGEGIKNYQASEQQNLQNAILKDVAGKQSTINQAVSQGTMNAQEAHVRSQAVYNEAIANYPQLADKFMSLNSVFKATTAVGDTDQAIMDQRDNAKKIRDSEDQLAISQGYHLSPDMTDAQRGVVVSAAQANVMAQKQLEAKSAQWKYQREQQVAGQQDQDRDNKMFATRMINDLAGHNFDSFDAVIESLRNDVKTGKRTPEDAQAILNTQYGQISGVLQATAAGGQIDASPYRSVFDSKYQLGLKMLDPKNASEELDRQKKDLITRQQLVLLGDESTKRLVATSQLLAGSNNPLLLAPNAQATLKAMAGISNTPTNNGTPNGYVPQVAGNPEVEGSALQALKFGVNQLRGGKMNDSAAGNIEASNSVNNILQQTGQLLNQGATPDKLKGLADFFASPEYAYMVQHGSIDPVAAQTAKKTFQMMYEPAVTNAIGGRLQGTLADSDIPISRAIDVNFSGAGINFVVRKGLSDKDAQQAQAVAENLKTAAQGANTLVRLGAHMEGTTDYQKYWNDNKYYILPQIYPVKPGQAIKWKDGSTYKWNGAGDWADRNNWSKVGNG
jgi:hypothetical protein